MILWSISFLSGILAVWFLFSDFSLLSKAFQRKKQTHELKIAMDQVEALKAMIQAGRLPENAFLEDLRCLAPPWGILFSQTIHACRDSGSPILPCLDRLEEASRRRLKFIVSVQSKASGPFGQAVVCFAMVPLIGIVLYLMLPSLSQFKLHWMAGNLFGMALAWMGGLWMLKMVDKASYGGIENRFREVFDFGEIVVEYFLSQIKTGLPPEQSWVEAIRFSGKISPSFVEIWGADFASEVSGKLSRSEAATRIQKLGSSVKQIIQASVLEGTGCVSRIESLLEAFRIDLTGMVESEMSRLGNRILKPLFIFVAPAVFLQFGLGLYLNFLGTSWL